MRKILLLLFRCVSLFANVATTESDPRALIEGVVNAITGKAYIVEEDIVAQGYHPLRMGRTYDGNRNRYVVFEHLRLQYAYGSPILVIPEPNGTSLGYKFHENTFRCIDFQGIANTAKGEISARTNLKNQYAFLSKHCRHITVHTPDGTERLYKAKKDQFQKQFLHENQFFLRKEIHPNMTQTIYQWDDKEQLQSITKADLSGNVYTKILIDYHGKVKEHRGKPYKTTQDTTLRASDGEILQYLFLKEGKKENAKSYLQTILSSTAPREEIEYSEAKWLTSIALPQGRYLKFTYDAEGRVIALHSPSGTTQIAYAPHKTTATDPMGFVTHYFFDDNYRLTQIHTEESTTRFKWQGINLKSKCVDGYYTINYEYDFTGNILTESFVSNLGTATKHFQYNEQNLLVYKEEANGLITTYEYLPNTSLLMAEHTLDKHTYYEYENGLLVTERLVHGDLCIEKTMIPIEEGPYRGMPKIIKDPFKEEHITYTKGGRIAKRETAEYVLTYKYDEKGRLIEESNALGQIAYFQYDELGNKVFEKGFEDQVGSYHVYDTSNNLIETRQGEHITRHTYDAKGNRIATIDPYGYETKTLYDSRGLVIMTATPHGPLEKFSIALLL